MANYSKEDKVKALREIESTIIRCEKMQPKFVVGTSQHTLLKNRISALYVAKGLLGEITIYTHEELQMALPPIVSIINKTTKAQSKYDETHTQYKRYISIIKTMTMVKELIENELDKNNR